MSDFSGILDISQLKYASYFTYHHTIGYLPKTTQIMESKEKEQETGIMKTGPRITKEEGPSIII